MRIKRFTYVVIFFATALMAVITSCQKDDDVKDINTNTVGLSADSLNSFASAPGNYLATTGTLQIKIQDSTYTFDAAHDSVAFVNVRVDSSNRYFGITAINKAHTMSFGISSSGDVLSNMKSEIAGSQLLIGSSDKNVQQYSLSKFAGQKDFGNIMVLQYKQDSVLAKGTFYTFLAKDDKANTPFYRVEGSFDLKLKK